jgi:phosphohistidine phosphatase SixA
MCKPILVLLALIIGLVPEAWAGEPPARDEVVSALRTGGYVLYLRHPKTNPDQADTDPLHLENVAAQRQLTDEGRAQAKAIGSAFKRLGVPIGRILSSQFFRAQEAARLLDVGSVETSPDVTEGGLVVSPRENQRRAAALRRLLSTAPPSGTNLLVVSHRPNLQDAAGTAFGDLGEGEIVVFRPLGEDGFEARFRIASPELWSDWTR